MSIEAYPLQWPDNKPRTQPGRRQLARFKATFTVARDELYEEIRRLGGRHPVLSSNLTLRLDGIPYANQREPQDPGVAVYFEYKGQQMCFACDKWQKVKNNIQAVKKTIEALRGIARWGSGDMMEQAFHGFKTLPAPDQENTLVPWWEILGCTSFDSPEVITQCYRYKRSKTHPDRGGSPSEFNKVIKAYEQARKEKGF